MESEKQKKDDIQILVGENPIIDPFITTDTPISTERNPMRVFDLIGIPYKSTNRFKKTIEIVDQFKDLVLDVEVVKILTPVTFKQYQNSVKCLLAPLFPKKRGVLLTCMGRGIFSIMIIKFKYC